MSHVMSDQVLIGALGTEADSNLMEESNFYSLCSLEGDRSEAPLKQSLLPFSHLFSSSLDRLSFTLAPGPLLGDIILFLQSRLERNDLIFILITKLHYFNHTKAIEEIKSPRHKAIVRARLETYSSLSFYFFNAETFRLEPTDPSDITRCRHPMYEGTLSPRAVELIPNTPEEPVQYGDILPIRLGSEEKALRLMSREELSARVSRQRGHQFLFKTSVDSRIPTFNTPIIEFIKKPDLYQDYVPTCGRDVAQRLCCMKFSKVLEDLQRLRRQFAICNMGEPIGFGLFNMGGTIPQGTVLGIYEGELTQNMNYSTAHLILHVDGDKNATSSQYLGGYLGMANHSYASNAFLSSLFMRLADRTSLPVHFLIALTDIRPNEEITWNYGPDYKHKGKALIFNSYGECVSDILDPAIGMPLD
jgi:SET domain